MGRGKEKLVVYDIRNGRTRVGSLREDCDLYEPVTSHIRTFHWNEGQIHQKTILYTDARLCRRLGIRYGPVRCHLPTRRQRPDVDSSAVKREILA